jgi:hypothetical protein
MKKGSAVRQQGQRLDRSILAAFKHANDAGRLDVAEHLLCALECLCGDAVEGSAAGEAYRVICCGHGRGDGKPQTECKCTKGRKQ